MYVWKVKTMGFIKKAIVGTAIVGIGTAAAGGLLYTGGKLNIDDAVHSAGSSAYSSATEYASGVEDAILNNNDNTCACDGSEDAGKDYTPRPTTPQLNKAADSYQDLGSFVAAQPPAVQRDIATEMYKRASPAVKENIAVQFFAELPYDNKVNALGEMAKEMEKTIDQQQHMALK